MTITFLGNFGVDFSSENHHAKSLESLGHRVVKLQERETPADVVLEQAIKSDLFIWVHTHGWETPGNMELVLDMLKRKNIPTMTYHLDLWFGLERQKDLETDSFYKHIQHFFTVDRLMADWFNTHSKVQGHYIRAGVFDEECYRLAPNQEPLNDVIFVGSRGYHPEWKWRPELIDWLKMNYGSRFKHYGGDGIKVVRGEELNQLYANTKVVVGDSLCIDFKYPDYWSDRVYETIGRGGFLLMPDIPGLDSEFQDYTELPRFKFGDFTDLKKQIDFYLSHDKLRHVIQNNAYNRVKNNYTYKHRWETILKELKLI